MTGGWRLRRSLGTVASLLTALTGVVACSAPTAHAQTGEWTIEELPPLPSHDWAIALEIDDAGRAMGVSGNLPVRWSAAGVPAALPLPADCTSPGFTASSIRGASANGHVIGELHCTGGDRFVVWPAAGGLIEVDGDFDPINVSNSGALAGVSDGHAAVWIPGGTGLVVLDDAGCAYSAATAITDVGLVVGVCTLPDPSGATYAVGWFGPYLFPLTPDRPDTYPYDVTDSGIVLLHDSPARTTTVLTAAGESLLDPSRQGFVGMDLTEDGLVLASDLPVDGDGPWLPFTNPALYAYGTRIPIESLIPGESGFTGSAVVVQGVNRQAQLVGWLRTTDDSPPIAWILQPPGT
jgi:hypothetical protein